MTQEVRSIHTQLCQILQNHRMILHDLNLDDPEIPAVEHYADLADELAAACEGMYQRHLQGVTPKPRLPIITTDGGPWATHDYACPVCVEKSAVLELGTGQFSPCWPCQKLGWRTKKLNWWDRFAQWVANL